MITASDALRAQLASVLRAEAAWQRSTWRALLLMPLCVFFLLSTCTYPPHGASADSAATAADARRFVLGSFAATAHPTAAGGRPWQAPQQQQQQQSRRQRRQQADGSAAAAPAFDGSVAHIGSMSDWRLWLTQVVTPALFAGFACTAPPPGAALCHFADLGGAGLGGAAACARRSQRLAPQLHDPASPLLFVGSLRVRVECMRSIERNGDGSGDASAVLDELVAADRASDVDATTAIFNNGSSSSNATATAPATCAADAAAVIARAFGLAPGDAAVSIGAKSDCSERLTNAMLHGRERCSARTYEFPGLIAAGGGANFSFAEAAGADDDTTTSIAAGMARRLSALGSLIELCGCAVGPEAAASAPARRIALVVEFALASVVGDADVAHVVQFVSTPRSATPGGSSWQNVWSVDSLPLSEVAASAAAATVLDVCFVLSSATLWYHLLLRIVASSDEGEGDDDDEQQGKHHRGRNRSNTGNGDDDDGGNALGNGARARAAALARVVASRLWRVVTTPAIIMDLSLCVLILVGACTRWAIGAAADRLLDSAAYTTADDWRRISELLSMYYAQQVTTAMVCVMLPIRVVTICSPLACDRVLRRLGMSHSGADAVAADIATNAGDAAKNVPRRSPSAAWLVWRAMFYAVVALFLIGAAGWYVYSGTGVRAFGSSFQHSIVSIFWLVTIGAVSADGETTTLEELQSSINAGVSGVYFWLVTLGMRTVLFGGLIVGAVASAVNEDDDDLDADAASDAQRSLAGTLVARCVELYMARDYWVASKWRDVLVWAHRVRGGCAACSRPPPPSPSPSQFAAGPATGGVNGADSISELGVVIAADVHGGIFDGRYYSECVELAASRVLPITRRRRVVGGRAASGSSSSESDLDAAAPTESPDRDPGGGDSQRQHMQPPLRSDQHRSRSSDAGGVAGGDVAGDGVVARLGDEIERVIGDPDLFAAVSLPMWKYAIGAAEAAVANTARAQRRPGDPHRRRKEPSVRALVDQALKYRLDSPY